MTGLFSSVTSHLPTSTRTESDSALKSTATTTDEELPLSQPSAVLETHDEVKSEHEEHPASTGLYQIMKSLLPLGLRSKSATVDEQKQPDEASKTIETTTTFHEGQPALETSTTEEFVDAQEPSTETEAESEESSGLLEKATSIVDRIMSSVSTALPTSKTEQEVSSSSLADARERTGSTEDEAIHADDARLTTTTTISKSSQDLHIGSEDVEQQKQSDTGSTDGLLEMMKSFPPSKLLSGTSTNVVSTEPSLDTTEDQTTTISSTTKETTEKVTASEDNLSKNIPSTTEVTASSGSVNDEDHVEQPLLTSVSTLNSIPSDLTHHTVFSLQASTTEEHEEQHGLFDRVVQAFSNAKETISNLGTSTQSPATTVSHEDAQQVELSEETGEKQTLLKAAQEILAVPLKAAAETYEKIVSGQDESSSRVEDNEQGPSLKASLLQEESEVQNESVDKPSHQQLQMIGDDYSRYSTHYTIADAEANIDLLYRNLSSTIEQLDQQPPVTSVEFQPEPHPQVATPVYDREALADTQDTREKVHELAQYSSAIVTTTNSSLEGDEKDEDGFRVVQRRKRIPSSTVYEKTSSSTTSKSHMSPDIDLEPVVLYGRTDTAVSPATAAPSATKATTSTKKKQKNRKKDKNEEILFDAPVPSSRIVSEQKPKVEFSKENLLASAITVESSDIDHTSEANKQAPEAVDVVEQPLESSVLVDQPEEEQRELVSASAVSDIEELKQVEDENNDSTSSDASQLLSSFTNLPDDDKTRQESIERPVVIETITTTTTKTVSSTPIANEQPELLATSVIITEPESEEPSPSSSSSSSAAQAQPKATIVSAVETSQKTTASKKVTPLEEEIDDDDGFQVVSYSKPTQPVTPKKKTPSVSSKASLEGTSSPDLERKSVASSERQDTSTSPSSSAVPKTTPRKKKDKKPKQDTPSTDTAIISSSPAESSEQQPREKVSQTSSVTSESKVKQPLTEEKTSVTSQLSSSPVIDQSSVATRAVLPPTGKAPSTTLRVKASTSPEEEDEVDDEGFQVVHYGKRVASASRTGKTTSPSPSKAGYQQKYGRNTDFRARGGQGRPGSETRLIPRRAPGDQRPPNRSQQNQFQQDRSQIPPFGAPRSPVTSTRQMSSSPNLERRPVEFAKPPLPDTRPQAIDSQLQSSFIDQTWTRVAPSSATTFEQQPITSGERQTTAASRASLSDQHEQQQKSERRAEQFSSVVSTFTPVPLQQTSQQAPPPVKVETKRVLPPVPTREVAPLTISSASPSVSRKTEEEDDDGFRVVRYRKNLPLSATGSPTVSKYDSVSSDSEKKQSSSPKKVSSPALTKAPVAPAVESVAPKPKPKKIKSSQGDILRSNILSSSTTDTDLHSASKEATETNPSSSTVEKTRPVQRTEVVAKPPVARQEATSTQVTEKSDEPPKKPKKKHKRAKQDLNISGQSTPSDEATSFPHAAVTPKQIISAPLAETPSVVEEKTDQTITNEETLTSVLTESTSAIDQEQGELPSTKKPAKRRKKKSQSTDKQEDEASLLSSSTTSPNDKEISATGSTDVPSATTQRPVSDDEKQESEWRVAQGRNKKSKTSEPSSPSSPQTLSFYPQSRLPPTSPKIVPEKVTDVQFKFKKDGELTMTSPSSVERSPTEWGTIQFLADQQSPPSPAPDAPSAPLEEPIALPTIETQPVIETTTELDSTTAPVSEIRTESETTTPATLSAGDLNAYRDPTGRLRRKKPRKHSNSTSKSESTASSVKDGKSADSEGDRRYISEQWADVLVSPTSNTDEERQSRPLTTEHEQLNQSFEDEDTSESSSKLDMFLPDYIRQQMKATPKTGTSPRSSSFTDERSKSSSAEPSMSFSPSRLARVTLLSSSNRSTSSTDTSENESRRQSKKPIEQDESKLITPAEETPATGDSPSAESTRKRKQRQKILNKDVEANTLLTQELDETTPLASSEPSPSTPVTQTKEDETKTDEGFLASIRQQFSSVISSISDSFTSALPSNDQAKDEEQSTLQSDAPVPSVEELSSSVSTQGSSETLTSTTVKKSSTRSPRKRSKRDSGPDYDNVSLPSTDDAEQSLSTTPPPSDHDQAESIKVETHKQQSRQRTASGRQMSSTEEDHEQRAVLADDEEDGSSASGVTSKRNLQKKKSNSEERELSAPAPNEPQVDPQETSADQSASNEQLRPVQGFHSFTPNLYQYNQYEEGPTASSDPVVPTSTVPSDTILSRGFNLWLQKGKEVTEPPTKDVSSSAPSGLTRAMQSLIIQPMESDDDEEEEEDSWNGPRARKPTYTTGIRTEKRIHADSAYSINHPRSTNTPSWLIAPSNEASHPDDPSRFDPDEEEDSIDDSSEKQTLAPSVATQLSTVEERQTHLNNLAELTFQPTIPTQSSSLSSAAKWNETPTRSEDPSQQQTSFTEDDVQRCLGEDFFRESPTADPLAAEQRTLTSLEGLVLKPLGIPDDAEHSDDEPQINRNSNNNNNHRANNFDEWAYFLERQNQHQVSSSSVRDSASLEPQEQPISYECSYARALNEDTFVSDLLPIEPATPPKVEYITETEAQRYGDFSSLHEHAPPPESTRNRPLQLSNREQELYAQPKPSETFHRWRNQSSLERQESKLTDDEIFVSHSDGGLSRRVKPPT